MLKKDTHEERWSSLSVRDSSKDVLLLIIFIDLMLLPSNEFRQSRHSVAGSEY